MKYILISLLILSSCSTERKCRKWIAKGEKLGCLKSDSVIIKDTLILTDYDTMVRFKYTNEVDTLFIDNGGIKTVVFTKWKTKEVRVIQKGDTIIKDRKVEVKKIVKGNCDERQWWDNFWIGFAFGILVTLIILRVRK